MTERDLLEQACIDVVTRQSYVRGDGYTNLIVTGATTGAHAYILEMWDDEPPTEAVHRFARALAGDIADRVVQLVCEKAEQSTANSPISAH